MDPFLAIALVVVVFMFGLSISITVMIIKNKYKDALEVNGQIIRMYTDTQMLKENFSTNTVDSFHSSPHTRYFIELKVKGMKKFSLRVKKKDFYQLHELDYGAFTYKGTQLISYFLGEFSEKIEKVYFVNRENETYDVTIYGEALGLNFSVASDQKVGAKLSEMSEFIRDLLKDESDWFFSLVNQKGVTVQIEREDKQHIRETRITAQHEEKQRYENKELLSKITTFFKS